MNLFFLAASSPSVPTVLVPIIAMGLSFALVSFTFFGLKYLHKKKHPDEEDVKETNRQRREREKLKRETTAKVNNYMSGKKQTEEEHVPNGKRCGKYKKKNRKK